MACQKKYAGLPCHLSGVGYTASPTPLGSASIRLQPGHGAQFPALADQRFFYVTIVDECNGCCETVKVVSRNGDTLTVERPAGGCDCLKANSRVRYEATSADAVRAIAEELDFNVVSPLKWDCATRTLSFDCAELKTFINDPCS